MRIDAQEKNGKIYLTMCSIKLFMITINNTLNQVQTKRKIEKEIFSKKYRMN